MAALVGISTEFKVEEIKKQFEAELVQRMAQLHEIGERIKELRMGIATCDAIVKQAKPPAPPDTPTP